MRRIVGFLAGLTLLTVTSLALAGTTTETAQSGDVTAEFSFAKKSDLEYKNLQLKITRAGIVVFNGPVDCTDCKGAWPGGLGKEKSVSTVSLDGGEPQVLVELYTGGAHCCTVSVIYSYDPSSGTYKAVAKNWGDPGYELKTASDGSRYFLSANDNFAYQFTAYAGSVPPVQTWSFQNGQFTNITCSNLNLVRDQVKELQKSLKSELRTRGGDSRGIVAALTADQYLLGKQATANAQLNSLNRRHRLNGLKDWPQGKRYIKALKAFLKKNDYVKCSTA